jgi:hypothetical protein
LLSPAPTDKVQKYAKGAAPNGPAIKPSLSDKINTRQLGNSLSRPIQNVQMWSLPLPLARGVQALMIEAANGANGPVIVIVFDEIMRWTRDLSHGAERARPSWKCCHVNF